MSNRTSVVVEGLDHPEGVTIDSNGFVYAGGEAGQIYRLDLDKGASELVAETGGFILGLCADGDGYLYVCDVGRRQVLRIDPSNGDTEVLSSGSVDRPFVSPNWAAFDTAGNLFVSDSGEWRANDGCIFRIDPSGHTTVWTTALADFPNSFCLDAEGAGFWIIESCAPAMSHVPIDIDGSAGKPSNRIELDGVPDGVTIDTEGDLHIGYYRPDRIERVDRDGSRTLVAEDPDGTTLAAPTNLVWTAPGTLLSANLGRWHVTRIELEERVTGAALSYPRRSSLAS